MLNIQDLCMMCRDGAAKRSRKGSNSKLGSATTGMHKISLGAIQVTLLAVAFNQLSDGSWICHREDFCRNEAVLAMRHCRSAFFDCFGSALVQPHQDLC